MSDALLLFVNGSLGVFAGMALVYAAIRLTAAAVGRWTGEGGKRP
ncbi:MAG: hypothetical protein Kow0092_11030 [Deferrisomatales bacterium]